MVFLPRLLFSFLVLIIVVQAYRQAFFVVYSISMRSGSGVDYLPIPYPKNIYTHKTQHKDQSWSNRVKLLYRELSSLSPLSPYATVYFLCLGFLFVFCLTYLVWWVYGIWRRVGNEYFKIHRMLLWMKWRLIWTFFVHSFNFHMFIICTEFDGVEIFFKKNIESRTTCCCCSFSSTRLSIFIWRSCRRHSYTFESFGGNENGINFLSPIKIHVHGRVFFAAMHVPCIVRP